PGETKSNVQIFRLLAERMGFGDACFRDTDDDIIRTLLRSEHPFVKGITLEELERRHFVRLNLGEVFLPFAEGGYLSADGKCEFKPETLHYAPPLESRRGDAGLVAKYPLELVSSKNDNSMNSTFGHRDATDVETQLLWMHTADAEPRGIEDGDMVRVFNNRGSVMLKASVNGSVAQGVVRAPSVRWPKRCANGAGINVLTTPRLTDIGGGAVFYSNLVQVERCGD
ncbi:MAG: molybdopterin oxidoreductase, partial [Bryobacterales bacterium]|nr:molybdopterin oxidoreductase [Bryobacterales bacterium]